MPIRISERFEASIGSVGTAGRGALACNSSRHYSCFNSYCKQLIGYGVHYCRRRKSCCVQQSLNSILPCQVEWTSRYPCSGTYIYISAYSIATPPSILQRLFPSWKTSVHRAKSLLPLRCLLPSCNTSFHLTTLPSILHRFFPMHNFHCNLLSSCNAPFH